MELSGSDFLAVFASFALLTGIEEATGGALHSLPSTRQADRSDSEGLCE